MGTLVRVFPPLAALKTSDTDTVELVNQTMVEEVLQELGELDFGRDVTANSNIAIWRERGTHHALCGEFAFQAKFKRRDELHEKAMDRCRKFFVALQQSGRDRLSARPRPGSSTVSRAIRPKATNNELAKRAYVGRDVLRCDGCHILE